MPKEAVHILSRLKRYGLMLLTSGIAFGSLSAQRLNELREAYINAGTASMRIETLAKISDYYIGQKNLRLALEYRARALRLNEGKHVFRFDLPIFSDGIEKIFAGFPLEKIGSEVSNLPADLPTPALLNLLAESALKHNEYIFCQSLANKALGLSKLAQNTLQEGVANYLMGYALYQKDCVNQAEPYLIEALCSFQTIQDDLYIVRSKRMLARANKWLYRLETAEKYASEALKLSYSLNNDDELFESLTKLRDINLWRGNYKEVLQIQGELLCMAKDKLPESDEWMVTVKSDEATILCDIGNYKEALSLQLPVVKWTETHQDTIMLPREYYSLGLCYSGMSVYDTAVTCFQKSLGIAEQTGNRYVMRQALMSLMELYFEVGDKEAAMKYNQQLEAIYAAAGADEDEYFTNIKYGWKILYFEKTGVLDSAIHYAKQSLYQATKDSLGVELANSFAELGRLYLLDDKLELAKSNLEKALKSANQIGQIGVACKSLLFLAQTARKEKDTKSAIEHAHASLDLAEAYQLTNLLPDLYKNLADAYSENGDFAEAYQYQTLFDKLQDSVMEFLQRQQISKYESHYRLKEKEVENKRLLAQKQQKDYDIKKRNLMLLILTIAIFFVTGSAYLIKERSKLQAEHKLRKQITRDIHDDVGSTINNLKMTIKEAIEEQPSDKATTRKLERAVQLGNRATESLKNLILRTEQEQASLKLFLEEAKNFAHEMLSSHQIPFQWQATGFDKKLAIPSPTCHHLLMLFKEALHNAIKHGENGSIAISMNYRNDLLSLSVKNRLSESGQAQPSTNKGLQNMRERVALLQGDIAFFRSDSHFEFSATIKIA